MKIKMGASKNEAVEFHHITEEERKKAQDLWNKFNTDLADLGMKLFYDYGSGGFYVTSSELDAATGGLKGALSDEELEQVVYEGGFDGKALNNPPWFTSPGEYSLRVGTTA